MNFFGYITYPNVHVSELVVLIHSIFSVCIPEGRLPGELHVTEVALDGQGVVMEPHVLEEALLSCKLMAADATGVLA